MGDFSSNAQIMPVNPQAMLLSQPFMYLASAAVRDIKAADVKLTAHAVALLDLEAKRHIQPNIDKDSKPRQITMKCPPNIEAVLVQITGHQVDEACLRCMQNRGPFVGCVVSTIDGIDECGNCRYNNQGRRCSFRGDHAQDGEVNGSNMTSPTRFSLRQLSKPKPPPQPPQQWTASRATKPGTKKKRRGTAHRQFGKRRAAVRFACTPSKSVAIDTRQGPAAVLSPPRTPASSPTKYTAGLARAFPQRSPNMSSGSLAGRAAGIPGLLMPPSPPIGLPRQANRLLARWMRTTADMLDREYDQMCQDDV